VTRSGSVSLALMVRPWPYGAFTSLACMSGSASRLGLGNPALGRFSRCERFQPDLALPL
jgi:hypothetical protein